MPAAANAAVLGIAFTPTQPRLFGSLFIGREAYLQKLLTIVRDQKGHVVLHGERGIGKTSLAYALGEQARRQGYRVIRRSCGSTTTYETLFRGIFEALPETARVGGGARAATPEHVVAELSRIRHSGLLVIIDEFDRIQSDSVCEMVAETIKGLSDQGSPVAFVIVGVEASLAELLAGHPSIQRSVQGVPLAPMTDGEVRALIAAGAKAAGIRFDAAASDAIVRLAEGKPYVAHALCLTAARSAAMRDSAQVMLSDLRAALEDLQDAQDPALRRASAQACAA